MRTPFAVPMLLLAAAILAAGFVAPSPVTADVTLSTVPAAVYKNRDPGRQRSESWLFQLVVTDSAGRENLQPRELKLEIFSGTTLRETTVLPESTVLARRTQSYRIPQGMDSVLYQRRFTLPEAFDLRCAFLARPMAWRADRVRVTLMLGVPGEANLTRTLDVPIANHAQKTALVFPLAGPALVSQGQFNNLGHAGHSNQFAIDVLGLNAEYGPMVAGRTGNEEYAGFGREVIAPAAGRVVYARNDVPDNAGDGDPVDTYRRLPDPVHAVAGNSVVIDHGNGEFSALMHLQHGSVRVRTGDVVQAGQVVARLGNSGDSFGAHLHYQLQDGPELLWANSLPVTFTNLAGADFGRGTYLTPK